MVLTNYFIQLLPRSLPAGGATRQALEVLFGGSPCTTWPSKLARASGRDYVERAYYSPHQWSTASPNASPLSSLNSRRRWLYALVIHAPHPTTDRDVLTQAVKRILYIAFSLSLSLSLSSLLPCLLFSCCLSLSLSPRALALSRPRRPLPPQRPIDHQQKEDESGGVAIH